VLFSELRRERYGLDADRWMVGVNNFFCAQLNISQGILTKLSKESVFIFREIMTLKKQQQQKKKTDT
jgi:hypothetical protein